MTRANAPQRVNVTALGVVSTIEAWRPVERPNIEAAAREGYRDACADRPFSRHYDDAPGAWQRNYEIGRLWAVGMKRCGIDPPEWPETMNQQPIAINEALAKVNVTIGSLRPEIAGLREPDPDLPVLHEPVRLPRRRWR